MESGDLTRQQCEQVRAKLLPMLRYLHALNERIRRQAFPPNDEVRVLAEEAEEAVRGLVVELHYLGIGHGVGRRPRNDTM
jgi:hypothetical protein